MVLRSPAWRLRTAVVSKLLERTALSGSRRFLTIAGVLWLAHVLSTFLLGTNAPGPLVSDVIQLMLGAMLLFAIADASRRSEAMARAFWNLAAMAYMLWTFAQTLGVYNDLAKTPLIFPFTNLLFSFWFAPLAMAMFLDAEH